jgi:hypothetical protein
MHPKVIFTVLFLLDFIGNVASQCTPPVTDKCEDAFVLCSLSELNGYCCSNTDYTNPTGCTPLCPSGGTTTNTGWWAFVCEGGNISISITVSNCYVKGLGVQMGIWGDCNCSESIVCQSSCNGPGTYTLSGTLKACKVYYLFVNGCKGDMCDFCLKTSGGQAPKLPPLTQIQGPKEVCAGSSDVKYRIDFGSLCEPVFEWTLNGDEVGNRTSELTLNFPDRGEFILCVTAYVGNPQSGSICDQQGPVCAVIRVKDAPVIQATEIICIETALNLKLRPNCFRAPDGRVICRGKDTTGCDVDTVLTFIVMDNPESPEVCYLAAHSGDVYKDSLTGKEYKGCHYKTNVDLPGSTDPYRCDSSYQLNMFLPEYTGQIRNYRAWGRSYLELRIWDISKTCGNSGIREEFSYSWYRKSDPLRRSLGRSDILQVNGQDTFCVDLSVKVDFCNVNKTYHFTFCANDSKGPKIGTKDSPFPDTTRWGFRDDSEDIGRIQHLLSTLSENKDEFVIHPMPNPSSTDHRIRLHSTLPIDEIILVDMSGRIVWIQESENQESLQMNLEVTLAPGMYQLIGLSSHFKSLSRIVVFP